MMPDNVSIHVIGCGMGHPELAAEANDLVDNADILVAGETLLRFFSDHPAEKLPITSPLAKVTDQIRVQALNGKRVVVLADGDPLCFGIGSSLLRIFSPEVLVFHPHVSALQAAASRVRLSWTDFRCVSLHGREDTAPLFAALTHADLVAVYTDHKNTPDQIARLLLERGVFGFMCRVCERLGFPDEALFNGELDLVAGRDFVQPNIMLLQRINKPEVRLRLGISEEELIFEKGLVTKSPVRAAGLSALELKPQHTLWDCGAGCGAVSLEAAVLLHHGRITAIEADSSRISMIKANIRRTGACIVEPVHGSMPEALDGLTTPDRIFIGGGLRTPGMLETACERLKPEGILVAHAILLDSLEYVRCYCRSLGWSVEISQINVSRSIPLAGDERFEALNPVFIVKTKKTTYVSD